MFEFLDKANDFICNAIISLGLWAVFFVTIVVAVRLMFETAKWAWNLV